MTFVKSRKIRIGIVGTGFIARGLSFLISNSETFHLSGVLTRRINLIKDLPISNEKISRDTEALLEKSDIKYGQKIEKAIGSFEMRGETLKILENPNHIPIGLISNAVISRNVEPGQLITFDDIEIPESLALKAWNETVNQMVSTISI